MIRIEVLLSTFNGEKYLEQQLDSIINQTVGVHILVRDDGSTDKTKQILDKYKSQGYLEWYSGENLKPARSFIDLLHNAPEADFYAFCDQDDYWKPNKLEEAVKKLGIHNEPSLYCSNTTLVDSELNIIGPSKKVVNCTFPESLVTNPVTGCTAVFNNSLRDIIVRYMPKTIFMHDWWIYQICLAVGGRFYFDESSYILYRQHGNNVVGGVKNESAIFNRHLALISGKKQSGIRHEMATELSKGFSDIMPAKNFEVLKKCVFYKDSWTKTLKFAFDFYAKIKNTRIRNNFILAVLFRKF